MYMYISRLIDKYLYNRANDELKKISKFKPDFVVYSIAINVMCILVIGEFKKTNNYSAIESDIVKLGKQMRLTYNDLVSKRILHPVVCGIICQGDDKITYFMDMQSPKQYRMFKISKVKLFKSSEELYFLPHIISSIVQLKNVALETSKKTEMLLRSFKNKGNINY
ncbi:hypothetical protein INT48_002184 [Thamnidium elegans]|uniref:Uncharacterized protein n=1 Tax=Thamnidium elegans TaxID=101142 RepID=A0A8H7SWW7_9FUNG|nr:hypothetical protein INT48_002184 [Thamnidium elegans]